MFEPLVRLDDDQGVIPNLADRWTVSDDGRTVAFHLRANGVWTNGDPVTATDFEYAWKRAMSPRFARANAAWFMDIVGAPAYTACDADKQDCAALRDRVGVEALDDVTLEVRLSRPAPWFVQRVAHWAFLPVHEPTIEKYKRRWTAPENIVTNGPFTLESWIRGSTISLVRWDLWRDATDVQLARIEGQTVASKFAGLAAFEADAVDACLERACVPARELDRLLLQPEFASFPAPATAYVGVNVERVPDAAQRQAMAIALNRKAITANAVPGPEAPAVTLTPAGVPGFPTLGDAYLTDQPRRAKAKKLIGKLDDVKKELTLAYPSGEDALASLVQTQLSKVGLDVTLEQHAEGKDGGADLYLGSVAAEDPDAIDVLAQWACTESENGFCSPEYDKLLRQARHAVDPSDRFALYAQLEEMLTGKKGEFPAIPVYWGTASLLRRATVQGFEPDLLGLVDFTKVSAP
jgi:oligopeptide transport system substrate-binding protein